jgi:hypothetical protein
LTRDAIVVTHALPPIASLAGTRRICEHAVRHRRDLVAGHATAVSHGTVIV